MSVGLPRLREEPDVVRKGAIDKGEDAALVDRALGLDAERRRLLAETEAFKAQRNDASKQIGAAIQKGAATDDPEVAELKRISTEAGERIKQLDASLADIEADQNLKTTSNVTERDVTLNINNAKAHQIITLHPKDSIVVNQTEGPITGTRTMTLSVPNNDNNETKIDVSWKMDLSRIPIIGKGFAKDGIFKTTEEALKKIASAAEKTP